jgi:hypothetical protein
VRRRLTKKNDTRAIDMVIKPETPFDPAELWVE